jgi:hypothetical protein
MSVRLVGPINSGPALGGAGVATANKDSSGPLTGKLIAVYVKYNDTPPAGTTDVVIATKGTLAPAITLLTRTNTATAGLFFPRLYQQDAVGVDLQFAATFKIPAEIPIADYVNVKIDQCDANDNIDVWLWLEE